MEKDIDREIQKGNCISLPPESNKNKPLNVKVELKWAGVMGPVIRLDVLAKFFIQY